MTLSYHRRARSWLRSSLQVSPYPLSNAFRPSSNARYASRSRNSTSHLTGQNMYMKMYNLSLVHSLTAKNPNHSNAKRIGSGMRTNVIDSSRTGPVISLIATTPAIAKTTLCNILSESIRSLSQSNGLEEHLTRSRSPLIQVCNAKSTS